MLYYSIKSLVVLDHFLMVAPALLVGSGSNGLAHHSVDVPFSPVFLASLDHFFEFDQKSNIFLVLFLIPVRSGESFFVVWNLFKTVNDFFRPEDPWFDLVDGNLVGVEVEGLSG